MTTARGHRQVDHTADLALELWAPSETALLEEAGQALVEILTDGASITTNSERSVQLETIDREDRLVVWMNEVLYWATVQRFVMTKAALTLDGDRVVGRVYGRTDAASLLKAELKSATYHDLSVEQVNGTWRARVVVDV